MATMRLFLGLIAVSVAAAVPCPILPFAPTDIDTLFGLPGGTTTSTSCTQFVAGAMPGTNFGPGAFNIVDPGGVSQIVVGWTVSEPVTFYFDLSAIFSPITVIFVVDVDTGTTYMPSLASPNVEFTSTSVTVQGFPFFLVGAHPPASALTQAFSVSCCNTNYDTPAPIACAASLLARYATAVANDPCTGGQTNVLVSAEFSGGKSDACVMVTNTEPIVGVTCLSVAEAYPQMEDLCEVPLATAFSTACAPGGTAGVYCESTTACNTPRAVCV